MDNLINSKPLKALLVAVQLSKDTHEDIQGSLVELGRLVNTLGYQVVGQTTQRRNSVRGSNVVGDGKLKELAQWTGGTGVVAPMLVKKKHKAALKFHTDVDSVESDTDTDIVYESESETKLEVDILQNDKTDTADSTANVGNVDSTDNIDNADSTDNADSAASDFGSIEGVVKTAQIIIFDCELSPSQLRNVESATGVPVLDRTGVIIEIFSRHARTRAAKLQVEIARLSYVAPRLRETGGHEDQQGGGGKGAGETSLELDRRKIRDRIKELKENLAAIANEQNNRRSRRKQETSVALVGYTNAGKSSLMRALTGSDVLVANQLFATLDTTVRALYPESHPRILISDTVGFIKKLPHDLVASFKSTLDEALSASLLLYVVDSSDPTFRSQFLVTQNVLSEVGVGDIKSLLLFNKIDRLNKNEIDALKNEFPDAIFISSKNQEDVKLLRSHIIAHFEINMTDEKVLIPYTVQGAIGEIRSKMRIISEEYDENGVILKVRATQEQIEKIKNKYNLRK